MSGHSPAGGSSAERVIACSGSVGLIQALPFLGDGDDDDSFSARGTAAHSAAAICLEQGLDAWQVLDQPHEGVELDADDAVAIQVYLDEIRSRHELGKIEEHFAHPEVHPWLYGTIDHHQIDDYFLAIDDYKHGQGIVKEAERNPQLMYYAYLVILSNPEVRMVRMGIHQPRGIYTDGRPRYWECSAEDIMEWADTVLLPAMRAAEKGSQDFNTGEHCRFCPAKLYCPVMNKVHEAACEPLELEQLPDDELAALYAEVPLLRMRAKAISDETERRMRAGRNISTAKFVNAKADRVWRENVLLTSCHDTEGATVPLYVVARAKLGDAAFTKPAMLSPAQMEKLPGGADFVTEYAFKPQTGVTVAPVNDKRKEVSLSQGMAERYKSLTT